jgi:hypothetical protein
MERPRIREISEIQMAFERLMAPRSRREPARTDIRCALELIDDGVEQDGEFGAYGGDCAKNNN